jgi:hypothetical protein
MYRTLGIFVYILYWYDYTPQMYYCSVELSVFIIPVTGTQQKVKILTVMYNLSWLMIVPVLGIRIH